MENHSNRTIIKKVLQMMLGEGSFLTMADMNMDFGNGSRFVQVAYIDTSADGGKLEIPHHIAWNMLNQNFLKPVSDKDAAYTEYSSHTYYEANTNTMPMIVQVMNFNIGDTVKCTLKGYDDIQFSGFVTGWNLGDLDALYVNGIKIVPSSVLTTRKVIVEKAGILERNRK